MKIKRLLHYLGMDKLFRGIGTDIPYSEINNTDESNSSKSLHPISNSNIQKPSTEVPHGSSMIPAKNNNPDLNSQSDTELHIKHDLVEFEDNFHMPGAILEELQSGRIPPYPVKGAMLRILHLKDPQSLDVTDLLDLYHGKFSFISEKYCDLFFKESIPQTDSKLLAIGFARDFKQISKCTSFMVSGWFEFGEISTEPSFFGEKIHTLDRMVRSFTEKSEVTLIITKSDHDQVNSFIQIEETTAEFLRVTKFTSITEILETFEPLDPSSYFRAPDDLAHTLNYLREKILENEVTEIRDAFYKLKSFTLTQKNQNLLDAYKSLLNLLIRLYRQNQSLKHIIASCISVAPNLFQSECLDDELKELFTWCLEFQDPRIKANTLEALGRLDPDNPHVGEFMSSKYNRVASEAIIIHGRRVVDDAIADKIIGFLQSPNPFFVASGLYLIGYLTEYHLEHHPDDYFTNPRFDKLAKAATKYKQHPHSMIRKRALATFKILDSIKRAS